MEKFSLWIRCNKDVYSLSCVLFFLWKNKCLAQIQSVSCRDYLKRQNPVNWRWRNRALWNTISQCWRWAALVLLHPLILYNAAKQACLRRAASNVLTNRWFQFFFCISRISSTPVWSHSAGLTELFTCQKNSLIYFLHMTNKNFMSVKSKLKAAVVWKQGDSSLILYDYWTFHVSIMCH